MGRHHIQYELLILLRIVCYIQTYILGKTTREDSSKSFTWVTRKKIWLYQQESKHPGPLTVFIGIVSRDRG